MRLLRLLVVLTMSTHAFSASLEVILPVNNHITSSQDIKVLIKLHPSANCSAQDLFVNHQGVQTPFQSTSYPGEYAAGLTLLQTGSHQLVIQDKTKKCKNVAIEVTKNDLAPLGITEGLIHEVGVGDPKTALKLSPFWGDSMLILGLQSYLQISPSKDEVMAFLDAFFTNIETQGMKKINHPDRAPVVMGNILYNKDQNRDFQSALRRFEDFISRPKLNKLGLIDHMGEDHFKRIGSALIFGYLGVANSVWADSMMMYVMPTILIGHQRPELKVTPDTRNVGKGVSVQATSSLKEFGLSQLDKMIDLLFTEDRLFKHTLDYLKDKRRPYAQHGYWLRSNGWALATMAMSLDYVDPGSALETKIRTTLKTSLTKMLSLADPETNLWRTIIMADGSYQELKCYGDNMIETSGSALVALALAKAIKKGVLGPEYKRDLKAIYDGLNRFMSKGKKGFVQMNWISGMTNSHRNVCDYATLYRPNVPNLSYGVGPYLLLTLELKKLGLMD